MPGRIVGLLHQNGLAARDSGVGAHGVGAGAAEGGGRIGAFFDHVGVGLQVLHVVVVARRLEGVEFGGLDDADAVGPAARHLV